MTHHDQLQNHPPRADAEQIAWTLKSPEDSVESSGDQLRRSELSQEAHLQLETWGVPGEKIDTLQVLAGQYEYADCLGKVKRLATQDAYEISIDEKAYLMLPNFFDPDDTKGGQCAEVADKIMRDLHESGWLESVNDELRTQGKPELHTFAVAGHAREFFSSKDDAHTWIALGLAGSTADDMVTIDGSMLEISSQASNGYKAIKIRQDPESNTRRNAVAPEIGILRYDSTTVSTDIRDPIVIGLTADRSLLMCIAFLKDETEGATIRPIIQLQTPDGSSIPAICIRIPEHGLFWADQAGFTTPEICAEAGQVYLEAEKMIITKDDHAAQLASERTHTIFFNTQTNST